MSQHAQLAIIVAGSYTALVVLYSLFKLAVRGPGPDSRLERLLRLHDASEAVHRADEREPVGR
jgi:hypothetical protein